MKLKKKAHYRVIEVWMEVFFWVIVLAEDDDFMAVLSTLLPEED